MRKKRMASTRSEAGMTLVEVIASIVILTIIVSTVFMIFIQSAKTTTSSEETINATYIAQSEMEEVYDASKTSTLEEWKESLPKKDYTKETINVYSKKEEGFTIQLELLERENGNVHILIRVYEKEAEQPKAQMENFYLWKDE